MIGEDLWSCAGGRVAFALSGEEFVQQVDAVAQAQLPVLRDLLPTIEAPPVLITNGARDPVVSPVNACYLHGQLPKSKLDIIRRGTLPLGRRGRYPTRRWSRAGGPQAARMPAPAPIGSVLSLNCRDDFLSSSAVNGMGCALRTAALPLDGPIKGEGFTISRRSSPKWPRARAS
jgi:hypothetical protein